jgi:adenine-specific DNA methylase
MQDAAQFSLGLFEGTALGWTLDAPRTTQAVIPASLDDDDDDEGDAAPAPTASASRPASNFYLDGERSLARGWAARARDNIAAIRLSKELEATGRAPTPEEQEQLLRFVGFGATDLAQNCFPLPGASGFRAGWEEIGQEIADLVTREEYAALQRATQYAHFTPETLVRALWRAAERLGFSGGKVLEPGMGTGLFFALLPPSLRGACQLTGVEYDPVTARIARFIHPQARIRCEDYTRSRLGGGFDLAIGNPPFADRTVRADPATAALGLRLHDYFG